MKTFPLILSLSIVFLSSPEPAQANGLGAASCLPKMPSQLVQRVVKLSRGQKGAALANTYTVQRFTNYEPQKRGINGRCGTSATGRDACQYFLEKHVEGATNSVMVAVPQRGPASKMFGGYYRLSPLQSNGVPASKSTGCIIGMAGDRYGTGSNGLSKMDVVTQANTKFKREINSAKGQVQLVGAVEAYRAGGKRQVPRKSRARAAHRPYRPGIY